MNTPNEDLSATVPESWRGQSRHFRPRRSAPEEKLPVIPALILLATGVAISGAFAVVTGKLDAIFIGGLLMIGAVIYFIPSMVAALRQHRNKSGIILLNIFLGWTLLGWVGALIWAMYEEKEKQ